MINNLKKFLNEEQNLKAIEKIAGKLSGLLMNGEEIEYIAVQEKPAVNLSQDCVAPTNKRIRLFCGPRIKANIVFASFVPTCRNAILSND